MIEHPLYTTQFESPNHYRGRGGHSPDTVVVHYTAGRGDARATARVFASPSRAASAHFCIGRDGEVVQCVDLGDTAWHAGDGRLPSSDALQHACNDGKLAPLTSAQKIPRFMNYRSVGIELCNRGWAPRGRNPYGTADHRNPASKSTQWESYSDPQIEALLKLLTEVRGELPSLRWLCGHEDVTHADTLGRPGAKLDPGPLFPWVALEVAGLSRVWYHFANRGWYATPAVVRGAA